MATDFLWLAVLAVVLLNASCTLVGNSTRGREHPNDPIMSFDEVVHQAPFQAKVEMIDIYYPWRSTAVDIYLIRADDGSRFCLQRSWARRQDVQFAHSLREGQSYVFPQVLLDFRQSNQKR
jgi:hypothetical protein